MYNLYIPVSCWIDYNPLSQSQIVRYWSTRFFPECRCAHRLSSISVHKRRKRHTRCPHATIVNGRGCGWVRTMMRIKRRMRQWRTGQEAQPRNGLCTLAARHGRTYVAGRVKSAIAVNAGGGFGFIIAARDAGTRSVWLSACQGIVTESLCSVARGEICQQLVAIVIRKVARIRSEQPVAALWMHQRWFSVMRWAAAYLRYWDPSVERKLSQILRGLLALGTWATVRRETLGRAVAVASGMRLDGKPSSHARLTCQSSELITWKEWKELSGEAYAI